VIGERLFRSALARERRRAERFGEAFALFVVSQSRPTRPVVWRTVINVLSSTHRDTDIVGWLEQGSLLGVIVPAGTVPDASVAADLESRVQLALDHALTPEDRPLFTIEVYRYDGARLARAASEPDTRLPPFAIESESRIQATLKRALDISASAALLIMLSPLFALVALLVKLKSPGPVFFKQERIGVAGKPFKMLKFRTMHVNNDSTIHQAFVSQFINAATPLGGNATAGTPFKIVNDPRVTSIGRFLRSSSIDELPQLWNVLLGDMSLVGPRPPLHYEVEQYKRWHYRRLVEAKPGITGLWQVSGRSRTTFDDMVRLDLRYAKKPSAWADIKILLATPRAVISGKGAC
jgi:exopolysaccharide biosynthesis polyprenyl glycosylphosphotransferase